ncbi:MAG: hypothetical protein JWQ94_609 [Tardiphaga sp.]|jgi:hypothetical protein|nr:hypothetical protein [Tardiphaga sp.]
MAGPVPPAGLQLPRRGEGPASTMFRATVDAGIMPGTTAERVAFDY